MVYTTNWFEMQAKKNFDEIVLKYFDPEKEIQYLEIGTFEGKSVNYIIDNLFKNIKSKATIIDPFNEIKLKDGFKYPITYDRFLENTYNNINKINIIKGLSAIELRKFEYKETFDLIYIDGDHTCVSVLEDIILSFPLLKKNGLLVVDNYEMDYPSNDYTLIPHDAIDSFLHCYKNEIEIIIKNYQVIVKKITNT